MSKLEDLINELCPDGVEWKSIQDTVGVNRGRRLTKSELIDDGRYEVYHGSKDTPLGMYNQFNAPKYSTIVVNTGGIGGVKYLENDFWCSDGSFWLGQCDYINSKYLYYTLVGYEDYFYSEKRVGGVPTIDRSVIEKFEIPVPPLPIQNEIVRILDKYSQLETDLETKLAEELVCRKKQYEYYRDKLLTFSADDTNVQWKTLGEVATIDRGGNFQKSDFIDNGKPCIHYGQMYTHFRTSALKTLTFVSDEVFKKSKIAHFNDIVMAVTSENVEDVCKCVAWLGNEDIAVSGHTAIIRHKQNAKYLAYYFQSSSFDKDKVKLAHGTKVIEVTPSKLAEVKIPIPSLSEQERIVKILDRFEALCNNLTSLPDRQAGGLPAEIEARHKQYEYYRDKLLTFKRKA